MVCEPPERVFWEGCFAVADFLALESLVVLLFDAFEAEVVLEAFLSSVGLLCFEAGSFLAFGELVALLVGLLFLLGDADLLALLEDLFEPGLPLLSFRINK